MPARIQSMSSTMRIIGCCPSEFFIGPIPRKNTALGVHLNKEGCSPVCPVPYFPGNLHICDLLTAYGKSSVAFAGYCLEHLAVIDAQIPPPVSDRSRVLHGAGHDRNTGAAHTQVLGYSLLRNLNHIILYAVRKEQQPDRKSLLDRMENGASGTL